MVGNFNFQLRCLSGLISCLDRRKLCGGEWPMLKSCIQGNRPMLRTSVRFNLAYWMELPYVVGVLKRRAHDSTLVTIVAQCTPGWKNRET